jgi:hypothetical protein
MTEPALRCSVCCRSRLRRTRRMNLLVPATSGLGPAALRRETTPRLRASNIGSGPAQRSGRRFAVRPELRARSLPGTLPAR